MNNKKKLFNLSKICLSFLFAFVLCIAISNTSEAATLGKVTNLKQTYGSYDTEYGKYFIDLEYNGVTGAYGYVAQLSTDGRTWQTVRELSTKTEFSIGYYTNLTAGSTYYVRIIPAYNSNAEFDVDDASAPIQVVTAPSTTFSTSVKQTNAKSNSITVSWSGVSSATSYNVYVKKYGDNSYSLCGSTKSTSYTLKKYKNGNLKADYLYYIAVAPVKTSTAGFTAEPDNGNGYPNYTLPSKISKVSATDWKPGSSTLKVSWTHTSTPGGYELQFYNAKGKSIKKVTTTKNSYSFTKAPKNSSCSVKIRPYVKMSNGSKKYAAWSKKFYFLSQADMSKSKYTIGYGHLTLRWTAVSGASKYTVYAGTTPKNMKSVGTVSGNTTSYTFSKISGSTVSPYGYYYVSVIPQKKLGGKTVKGDHGYYWRIRP